MTTGCPLHYGASTVLSQGHLTTPLSQNFWIVYVVGKHTLSSSWEAFIGQLHEINLC